MNGREKSHSAIVAMKPTNKAGRPVAEPVEPRAGTKGNAEQGGTLRTLNRAGVFPGLDRERRAANTATPLDTQGKNRMPELGTYGSVRGALSNGRPYRDRCSVFFNRQFIKF